MALPRDIKDLQTYLYHACGGRLYRILVMTLASSVEMSDGVDLETRINTIERALSANTTTHFADTLEQRDHLPTVIPGDRCFVFDASADETVGEGSAMYIWLPSRSWRKLYNGDSPIDCRNLIRRNGGLAVGPDGKLYVDFSLVPKDQKKDIANSLVNGATGGLGVDADGRLYIDLSKLGEAELAAMIAVLAPELASALAGPGLGQIGSQLGVNTGNGLEIIGDKVCVRTGAGLNTDKNGNLVVDFSAGGESIKQVIMALVKNGGGLAADANGQLYVDFEMNVTDTTLQPIMKRLGIPFPLTRNRIFYVDQATGSDDAGDGRGESRDRAFATIQAAVNHVVENYNMAGYNAYIRVMAGTYRENVNLPDFSRTTGRIILEGVKGYGENNSPIYPGDGEANPVTIICDAAASRSGADRYTLTITAGGWTVRHMDLQRKVPGNSASVAYASCLQVLAANARISGIGLVMDISACDSTSRGGYTCLGCGTNSVATFAEGRRNSIRIVQAANNPAKAIAFSIGNSGNITFPDAADNPIEIELSGSFSTILYVDGGRASLQNGDKRTRFTGSPTGKKYACVNGGSITGLKAIETTFPGDADGTTDAASFSWCS